MRDKPKAFVSKAEAKAFIEKIKTLSIKTAKTSCDQCGKPLSSHGHMLVKVTPLATVEIKLRRSWENN